MAHPAKRWLTYDDLLAANTGERPTPELMDGEIVYKASPRAKHSHSQGRVLVGLDRGGHGGRGSGWWLLVEPDTRFSTHCVLVPDIAGWRRERLPSLPEGCIDVRPDWVCEVLSPGHENHDRVRKMAIYLDAGVPWVWLVHPEERRLEVFGLQDGQWILRGAYADGAVFHIEPFEDTELDVSSLFTPREDEGGALLSEARVAYHAPSR